MATGPCVVAGALQETEPLQLPAVYLHTFLPQIELMSVMELRRCPPAPLPLCPTRGPASSLAPSPGGLAGMDSDLGSTEDSAWGFSTCDVRWTARGSGGKMQILAGA